MTGWLRLRTAIGFSLGSGLVALGLPYLLRGGSEETSLLGGLASLEFVASKFHLSADSILLPVFRRSEGSTEATTTTTTTSSVSSSSSNALKEYHCHEQDYSTQIISLDPLVIYIKRFLHADDIAALLAAGEGEFAPSYVTRNGRTQGTPARTSWSAGLSRDEPAVRCVLARAQRFMGTLMAPGRDDMGPPQLVRYTAGQRFNIHHDWFENLQPARDGRDASWNRVASFFAILEDGCVEGETWFPYIKAVSPQDRAQREGEGAALWREHEDGGLAFRPVTGNALFWVNLHANGTGDERVRHAGLPVRGGRKTAMNIWPRLYVGPGAWDPPVTT